MKTEETIESADLFCGGGGLSQGLLMAANDMGAGLKLVAVNHSNIAIETHSMNHSYAEHLCNGLDNVDPRKLVPSGHLHILCASPECTHHSNARGGQPMSDQSRSSAWHICRFAEALYIDNILIENIAEFRSWGQLGRNGRPLKSKKGKLFEQFINTLKALGYKVEWRIINCADYGDATSRSRLFIIARRGNKKIHWPEPTHVPPKMLATRGLFAETRQPWKTAREIIDWSIPSQSIFERKKPLCNNTLRRIEAGLKRFCGIDLDLRKCFLEDLRHGQQQPGYVPPSVVPGALRAQSLPPFLIAYYGTQNMSSTDSPLPTITTKERFGLVEVEVTQYRLDIRFRMLQPVELARAQGFPATYRFSGSKKDVVKSIGNSVPPGTAKALITELLRDVAMTETQLRPAIAA